MSTTFRPYSPDQLLMMPPNLSDWVPEGHLSRFISETVEELDLRKFYEPYEGDGRRNCPYDPRMILKVLIYGYATGVFSSRKVARKLEEDVAFRMLAAGNFPNFRTIATFRREHLGLFKKIFIQVVRLAKELGFVKLGLLALDGSKVKANASKRKAMSYGRMKEEEKRLEKEIAALTRKAQSVDEEEDREFGEDCRGDELPEELRFQEKRLEKIREAKKRLEERQRQEDLASGRKPGDENKPGKNRPGPKYKRGFGEPKDSKQENFTDGESRIMKTSSQGFQQSYNAQIAVDDQAHLIVGTEVGNNAADHGFLIPLVDAVEENCAQKPEEILADAGYRGEENFEQLEQREITGYISLGKEKKKEEEGAKIDSDLVLTQTMQERLQSEEGKKKYARRKGLVEPAFGWVKHILGFERFSLRSLKKVKGEWDLVCLALNLRRMAGMRTAPGA